jgi:hypothetical protein
LKKTFWVIKFFPSLDLWSIFILLGICIGLFLCLHLLWLLLKSFLFWPLLAVLGHELRAYTMSHSTAIFHEVFCFWGRVSWTICTGWLNLWSSWSLPPE